MSRNRRVPMTSRIEHPAGGALPTRVQYTAGALSLEVTTDGSGRELDANSFEAFISEHYWGYTTQRDGGTIEYSVTHPSWRVAQAESATVTGDLVAAYGRWGKVLSAPVHSAWLADGSPVAVYSPVRVGPRVEAV